MKGSVRTARVTAYLVTAALVGDVLATVVSGVLVRDTTLVGRAIAPTASLAAAPPTTEPITERFRPIFERNLFGARTEAPACNMDAPRRSPLMDRYELVGTVVAADAAESRAVIRPRGADGDARTLVPGSIVDDARVTRIEPRRILVDARGAVEALAFDLDTSTESVADPRASPVPAPTPDVPVTRAADGAYEIDGETFRRLGADPAPLMRDARFVPDGNRPGADGWRIFAVKPGSLFAQLGLVDGDVVRAVGSTRLAGLDATLAGLTALREAHAFEVTVERGHVERTLRYRVR